MLRGLAKHSGARRVERAVAAGPFLASQNAGFATWLNTLHFPSDRRCATSPETGPSSSSLGAMAPGQQSICPRARSYATKVAFEDPSSEIERLPRFLRRQQLRERLAEQKDGAKEASGSPSPKDKSGFRSKHFDPSKEKDKGEIRLLEPHVLSQRLKKQCDMGKLNDAVEMLKNAPLDAQNTPVWNTLIWECMKAQRFQLAYKLYVDMKRRGFSPTTRTFQTMFTGLSKIDNWVTYTQQLTNARNLYTAFLRHIELVKREDDPNHPELSSLPLAPYFRILGNAGCYQELFDAYYALPRDGPMAPNTHVYTAMFQALNACELDSDLLTAKVASDARLIWTQLTQAVKKNPAAIQIDSQLVGSAILALSGGTNKDHDLAFQLAAHYFGLVPNQTFSSQGTLRLDGPTFNAVLKLCNSSQNPAYCAQYHQQVKRRTDEEGGASILDRGHMEEIIRANIAIGEPGLGQYALETLEWMLKEDILGTRTKPSKTGERSTAPSHRSGDIRPAPSTYNLVLVACWKDADIRSALRTFELMTGYHAHDFMDGSVAASPRLDKRGPGRSYPVTAEFLSTMVKTALATKDSSRIRQMLRIVNHLGLDSFFKPETTGGLEKRKKRNQGFFVNKLVESVGEAVGMLHGGENRFMTPADREMLKNLDKLVKGKLEAEQKAGGEAAPAGTERVANPSKKKTAARRQT